MLFRSGQSYLDNQKIIHPNVSGRSSALTPVYPQQPIALLARQGLKVGPQAVLTFQKGSTEVKGYFDATGGSGTAIYSSLATDRLGKSSIDGLYKWFADSSLASRNAAIGFNDAATNSWIDDPMRFTRYYASLEEDAAGLARGSFFSGNFTDISAQNILNSGGSQLDLNLSEIGGFRVKLNLSINEYVTGTVNKAIAHNGEFRFYVLPNYEYNKMTALLNTSDVVFDGGRRAVFVSNHRILLD